MTEPTLADAERVIERTKACRGTCRDKCDIVQYEVTLTVVNGSAPPLNDTLRADMAIVLGRHLGPDWIHAPNSTGFLRRCQSCATEQQFPWADQLQAERVLEFMKPRAAADCGFFFDELKETLG